MDGVEEQVPMQIASSSGSNDNPTTEIAVVEPHPQNVNSSMTASPGRITKILPSDVDVSMILILDIDTDTDI